ncbi:MAG: endonuclease/exonuclease/phosphatase family protein [Verrucomicrobiota bacterium]
MLRVFPNFILFISFLLWGCSKDAAQDSYEARAEDEIPSSQTYGKPTRFTVVAYNVENLFDIDGKSNFPDYRPPSLEHPRGYTASHLLTKLENIAEVLSKFRNGEGPDIILFQELESDLTPNDWDGTFEQFLAETENLSTYEILTSELAENYQHLPIEVWLWRILFETGLGDYNVAMADHRNNPLGRPTAHRNGIFTKFPIISSDTHHSAGARSIQEVKVDIDGNALTLFNNHWKSGTASEESELIRTGNARVLRTRVDAVLKENPQADFIIAGDFNSHYNQKYLFPGMERTGINDVLGIQGDELAIRTTEDPNAPSLYSLWYELPAEKRYSEIFNFEHYTLMNMIIPRGLYDYQGIQYVDNSFRVIAVPGLNANEISGVPKRWSFANNGYGYSDHFPIAANFTTVLKTIPERYLFLEKPTIEPVPPQKIHQVNFRKFDLKKAIKTTELPPTSHLQNSLNYGNILYVEADVTHQKPFKVQVDSETFVLWSHDKKLRTLIFTHYRIGEKMKFYAELNQYRGNWQFVIHDPSWLIE